MDLRPHTFAASFLLFCAALLVPGSDVHAQVVNVMPLIAPKDDSGGFHAEAAGGGSLMTGNVQFLSLRGSLLLRHEIGRHHFISSSTAEFGRGAGDPFLNRQTSHLRYQNHLSDRITAETFLQATHDDVWRLKLRALGGVGARLTLIDGDAPKLILGLGYLIERERYSEGAFVDSGLQRVNHRLASYTTFSWRIDPQLSLVQTVFFQPRFDDLGDLRLFSQSALVVKLRERLALSVTVLLSYNSWTPETILPVDTSTVVSLTASL